jgi:hypothetical protein
MVRMARKQLLPEVVAEREQATADYHAAQRAAIERIATLRALRMAREAGTRRAPAKAARKG